MTEEKYVTYRHLKKGQEISGAKQGNSWHGFKGYVKEANAAYALPLIQGSPKLPMKDGLAVYAYRKPEK